ncbi:hypothetical protein ABPG74_011951 [Tetrahymena malaccensis]
MGNYNQIEKENKILELSMYSSRKLSQEQFKKIFNELSKQGYILERLIGEGNFGVVYEASITKDSKINTQFNNNNNIYFEKVAVKLMKIEDDQTKINVLKEFEIQKKCHKKALLQKYIKQLKKLMLSQLQWRQLNAL